MKRDEHGSFLCSVTTRMLLLRTAHDDDGVAGVTK
jgi:hypothetical protein